MGFLLGLFRWVYPKNQPGFFEYLPGFLKLGICAVRWWILKIQQGFRHTCIEIKQISATASVKARRLWLKWLSVRFQFQVSATAISGTWFWHDVLRRQSGPSLKRLSLCNMTAVFYPAFHMRGSARKNQGVSPPVCHPSHSPTLQSSLPFPTSPLEVGHPARGSGERCKLPQRGLRRSPGRNWIWCILALKSDIWFQQI